MPYWKPLIIDGKIYDLSHLEPFEIQILPAKATEIAIIHIRFHDHCFTEDFDPDRHAATLTTSQASKHERRAFCHRRYQLSKSLPDLIRGLNGKRIAQTRKDNLVRIEMPDGENYAIFFTLRREGSNRCGMFIVSAYPLEKGKQQIADTGDMKFNVAVALVLAGRKPKFPPRN